MTDEDIERCARESAIEHCDGSVDYPAYEMGFYNGVKTIESESINLKNELSEARDGWKKCWEAYEDTVRVVKALLDERELIEALCDTTQKVEKFQKLFEKVEDILEDFNT